MHLILYYIFLLFILLEEFEYLIRDLHIFPTNLPIVSKLMKSHELFPTFHINYYSLADAKKV